MATGASQRNGLFIVRNKEKTFRKIESSVVIRLRLRLETTLPRSTSSGRFLSPDLVEPEPAAFAIGMVGIKDAEARLSGEGLQLGRRKVVNIA